MTVAPFMFGGKNECCDILVITTCETDYFQTESLWENLKNRGFIIKFENDSIKNLVKSVFIYSTSKSIPACLIMYASFARFLVDKYNPKVICVFTHFNVLPSFIRYYSQAKTVYIPHAVVDSSYLYSNIDFDYYLVFGESSIMNIQNNQTKIGHTKIIKVGSPVVRENYNLPRININKNYLFFSTWTMGKDVELTANFYLMLDWARNHPDYTIFIKQHPNENPLFIRTVVKNLTNVIVLKKELDIVSALKDSSIVIINYSTASIEACLMNRPLVIINQFEFNEKSDDFRFSDKYLYLETFFPPRAKSIKEIDDRIWQIQNNYDYYIEQCRVFTRFHLENLNDSVGKISEIIDNIYNGLEDFTYEEI
jgi:CDP-glycerol glycerophosphotransferase (TagB/SpsB family)